MICRAAAEELLDRPCFQELYFVLRRSRRARISGEIIGASWFSGGSTLALW
jgi:hypothetical protein